MDEGRIGIIVHIAQGLGHAAGEDSVGGVQDLPPGAEVFPQQDALCAGIRLGVEFILFVEDRGIGQAKAVNGLLDIPHQKEAFPPVGHGGENGVLHAADILVLVHHHLGVAPG